MSETNVIEMKNVPCALSDSEKLKLRNLQLKISNVTASKLKLQADFAELEKIEAKSVEEYNSFLGQYESFRDKYGLDYETMEWVPLEKKE